MTKVFMKRNITAKVQIRDETPAMGIIRISEFLFTDVKSTAIRMNSGALLEIEAENMVTTDIKDLSTPTHIHTSMIYPAWTKELPKKNGWYWIKYSDFPDINIFAIEANIRAQWPKDTMFCGPIPEPPMEAP